MSKVVFKSECDEGFVEVSRSGFLWWTKYNYIVLFGYVVRTGSRSTFVDALESSLLALKALEKENAQG